MCLLKSYDTIKKYFRLSNSNIHDVRIFSHRGNILKSGIFGFSKRISARQVHILSKHTKYFFLILKSG